MKPDPAVHPRDGTVWRCRRSHVYSWFAAIMAVVIGIVTFGNNLGRHASRNNLQGVIRLSLSEGPSMTTHSMTTHCAWAANVAAHHLRSFWNSTIPLGSDSALTTSSSSER